MKFEVKYRVGLLEILNVGIYVKIDAVLYRADCYGKNGYMKMVENLRFKGGL